MLYEITQLKAPWPEGAKVGDVVELADVPLWAVGKCKEAPADAIPTVDMGSAFRAQHEPANDQPAQDDAEAQAERERLAIATKDDLRAQAEALGINVDARWGVKRLAEEIEIAKAKG